MYAQLVDDANMHVIGTSVTPHLRGTSPDYRAMWQKAVHTAQRKLHAQKRRVRKRKGLDGLQDATLHTGLKRQKGRKGQKVILCQAGPTSDTSGPGVGSSFRLKAPGCQLLVKWKSQEEQGVLYKENGLLTRFFTKKKTGCSQRS